LKIQYLSKIFNDSIHSPDFIRIKTGLDTAYKEIVNTHRAYTFNFILQNINSLSSLMALYQQIGPHHYLLDPVRDFRFYVMVDSSLNILYPESEAVRELHRQVVELQEQKRAGEMASLRLSKGSIAPEISLQDPEGDTISLSSLRGKYVLLDFWASWCSPCRGENPNLVNIYKKYHADGFEIYQVSLDRKRNDWLKAIEKDKLTWIHVSDLKMWNSVVVPIYQIGGIPMNFLLDPEGRIIDQNLRGNRLNEVLQEIFGK
jgi:thiol-disulfide isomerase/thioredoxin